MTDSTTRALERTGDTLALALRQRREGQPYDAPTLLRAGAIDLGELTLATRCGDWTPGDCETCENEPEIRIMCDEVPEQCTDRPFLTTAAQVPACGRCQVAGAPPCLSCLNTGHVWSEKHAELAAYAGEASCREALPGLRRHGYDGTAQGWLSQVIDGYSPHAPIAAALGVAREWHRVTGGSPGCCVPGHRDCPKCEALDGVQAWLWDPSEERAGQHGLVWAVITEAARDLTPEQRSAAARAGVLRWVTRGVA